MYNVHTVSFLSQLATLAPSSLNRVTVSVYHARPTAAPALEHPLFAPVELATTAQIPILQTPLAQVNIDLSILHMRCFKIENVLALIRTMNFSSNIVLVFVKQSLSLCGECFPPLSYLSCALGG